VTVPARGDTKPPGCRQIGLGWIDVEDADGITIAAVGGEIDISNSHELEHKLLALPGVAPALIIDLSRVDFLDSCGLAVLHNLAERARHRSQRLVIVCWPSCLARRVIDVTGLGLRLTVVDDRDDAFAQLIAG
jgi:anti-anti-sigma factor